MNFNWKWPEIKSTSKTNPAVLLLSLGLAVGFACGQVIHSSAECNQSSKAQANESASLPVKIHSSKTDAKSIQSLSSELNNWRAEIDNLSLMPAFFSPWRSFQLDDLALPFEDFKQFDNERAFDWHRLSGFANYVPRIESSESGNEIRISAEVPGVDSKNLDVTVNDDSITIKGETKEEKSQEESSKKYHRLERVYGAFSRSISLPCRIESDKAQASLKNGVLTIVAPKSQVAEGERKKLSIKQENG